MTWDGALPGQPYIRYPAVRNPWVSIVQNTQLPARWLALVVRADNALW